MVQEIKATRAVDQASDSLRQAILAGEFPSGSFLPAERALAEAIGVNRLTLRASIARLESEGLLRAEHGMGVRVLNYRATAGLGLLPHLVDGPRGGEVVEGFLELRRLVGVEAVALACVRADEEQLQRLEALADQQAAEEDVEAFVERDLLFVRQVIQATGNLALELVFNSVEVMYRARPSLARAMVGDLDEVRQSYRMVVEVIRSGDQELARRSLRGVLEAQDERTTGRLLQQGRGR
jgi:GntR family transcriptional regulator, transcriptional repressor for pyruvate dehydrogenase complex